jgi:hypothetical protein
MKVPRLSPDQLLLVLLVGMVIAGLGVWRYMTLP